MDDNDKRATQFRYKTALLLFLAAAGFYAWTEHRAHLFGVLPYLILLLCPFSFSFVQSFLVCFPFGAEPQSMDIATDPTRHVQFRVSVSPPVRHSS